jgi:hypothetical protein
VGVGRDHTLFARAAGRVRFLWNAKRKQMFVAVLPQGADDTWLNQHIVAGAKSPSWDSF